MKFINYLTAVLLFILCSLSTQAQTTDTTVQDTVSFTADNSTTEMEEQEEDEDFSLLQFIMILIVFGIIIAGIGAGMVFTVVGLFALFGLVSLGVLSTSVIVGLNQRSITQGFKATVLMITSLGGIPAGAVVFWALNLVFHLGSAFEAMVAGAVCGLISGLGCGLLASYAIKRLSFYFKSKLNLQ